MVLVLVVLIEECPDHLFQSITVAVLGHFHRLIATVVTNGTVISLLERSPVCSLFSNALCSLCFKAIQVREIFGRIWLRHGCGFGCSVTYTRLVHLHRLELNV